LFRFQLPVIVALLASTPAVARGHVGPSPRENNRYVKVTLLGDRARLLYTYYVGELPGARARQRLDANEDGVLQPSEADAFGAEVAAALARTLELHVDGAPVEPAWERVDVGLGTSTVNAGAFSVDLEMWLCLTPNRHDHTLLVRDRWQPPQAGETEVRVEASPGIQVSRSSFGPDAPVSKLRFKWVGGAGPLAREGLYVAFTAADDAALGAGACQTTAPMTEEAPRTWWSYAIAALASALVIGLARRRSQRNTNG